MESQAGVASGIKAQAQLWPPLREVRRDTLPRCHQASKGSSFLQWQWLAGSGLGTWVQTLWPSESLREEAVQGQETVHPPTGHREPQVNSMGEWRGISFHPQAKESGCEQSRVWLQEGAELAHPSDLGKGTQSKEASGSPENCPRSQSVLGHVTERRKNTALQLQEDER